MPANGSSSFDPHYLKYLADIGSTNLHAAAAVGTERLRSALKLQQGQRLLEIGCGTGSTMVKFALESAVNVDGVDVLEQMLRVARLRLRLSRLKNPLVRADATVGLPFRDETYDAVFSESVLGIQPTASADTFLHEVSRVLKVGGRFVANEGVWKVGTLKETVAAINQSCIEDFGFAFASSAGWSTEDWAVRMSRAGLTVVRIEELDLHASGEVPRSSTGYFSRLATVAFRVKATLNPRMLGRRHHYQKLLEKHREDHRHIEAKLFVATKT